MKNFKILFFAFFLIPVFLLSNNPNDKVKILLLTDNYYGSSYSVSVNKIKSIKTLLESYGWKIQIAAVADTVSPCPWGKDNFDIKTMKPDMKITDSIIVDYDAIIIIPGRIHENLIKNPNVIHFIQEAYRKNKVIAAWCRGVKVLTAANIVKGEIIIGHIHYAKAYEAAGADYIKYEMTDPSNRIFKNITPPVSHNNIITTVRSLYYRDQMCQLIKNAVDKNRNKIRKKLEFSKSPVWSSDTKMITTGLGFADMDLNGYKDIIISNGTDGMSQPASIYYNRDGEFSDTIFWQSKYRLPSGNLFISDLNANRFPDLVISHLGLSKQAFQPGSHVVFYNEGGFKSEPDWSSLPANGFSCTGGDFDGDGDMDLAFGQGCNALKKEDKKFQKTVIYENVNGKISSEPVWETDAKYLINDIAAVDIDNDGDMDLVISGKGYGISVFYNRDRTLEHSPSWKTNSIIGARQMAFGDYNNDGYEDLAIAAPGKTFGKGGNFYLFKNNKGKLEKEPVWKCETYQEPSAVQWADFDADGDLDLVGCGFFAHLGIFENKNKSLSEKYKWAYESKGKKFWCQQLAVADYDEDYMIDEIQEFKTNGLLKLFKIKKNLHEIPFIRVNDKILEKNEYCYDLQEGWVSLKDAPKTDDKLTIYYRFSMDLDIAVSAINKISLFNNMNVK